MTQNRPKPENPHRDTIDNLNVRANRYRLDATVGRFLASVGTLLSVGSGWIAEQSFRGKSEIEWLNNFVPASLVGSFAVISAVAAVDKFLDSKIDANVSGGLTLQAELLEAQSSTHPL